MNSGNFPDGAQQGFQKPQPVDPMIGMVLSERYQIARALGNGGMGAVYLATNIALGKPVAVKIMHPQLMTDDRTVQRFEHEVKAMTSLSHPNLISIIDAGKTDYGTPYFVMEYLPSRPLSDVLAEEVYLPADRVKKIIAQCADALSHAHARNIIHRDLKPANILVIQSGEKDHIKIVDLGVAKLIGGDAGALQKLTQTGEVFGSPLYMAPEQVLGKPHDGRTDIYQLGCVLFEMVTGVPPLVKPSAIMTMNSHVTEDAPTFNKVMPELPMDDHLRQLEKIVLKCLAKNPADRYQTMSQLLQAVEREPEQDTAAMKRQEAATQPVVQEPKSIKERFMTATHLTEDSDDFESSKSIVELPPGKYTDTAQTPRANVAKARQHGAKIGGFDKNHLIIGGAVVLFLFVIAAIVGIYSIVASRQQAQSDASSTAAPSQYKLYNINYPAVSSDNADLRILSVYQGETVVDPTATDSLRKGTVDVDVKSEDKPLVLVLNAYMPTTWNIRKATDKVKIKRVITVGYYSQNVNGVPPTVVHPRVYHMNFGPHGATDKSPKDKNAFDEFYFLYLDQADLSHDSGYKEMKKTIEHNTKLHLRNFQGIRTTPTFTVADL